MITKNLTHNHFLYTKEWESLAEIQHPQKNLVILERSITADLQNFLFLLQKEAQVPTIQETLPLHRIKSTFKQHLQKFYHLNVHGYQALIEDVYQLAWQFSQLVQQRAIKVYFAKIEDSMCRLFHTDANELRLLCTYWGKGTQWIDNQNIRPITPGANSNADRVKDLSKVFSVKSYDVAILKGALHDHIATNALVHRSPPLENNECRLLLRLDVENVL